MVIKLLPVFVTTVFISISVADIEVSPASGGTNLTPVSTNVSNGWAALGDIVIAEEKSDDIAGGQTNATLILSAPGNWEFQAGEGELLAIGDVDDTGIPPPSISVTSSVITISLSTRGEGNSGTNEIDIIVISGIYVSPVNPALAPSAGQILRTGGTIVIAGGAVSNNLNYGDLSLDLNNPLPVELRSFTASVKHKSVYLSWETITEVNNYGFEIERSGNKIKWDKLSFIAGSGNSNSPKSYNYIDRNLNPAGDYYYRLKQIDNDGVFEYSSIIEAYVEPAGDFELLQNYPNPFNPETRIKFSFDLSTKAEIKVFDSAGNEVASLFNGTVEGGRVYEIIFNAENLSSGIYYYRLKGNNQTKTMKMLLLK